jgi:hypothetical protein
MATNGSSHDVLPDENTTTRKIDQNGDVITVPYNPPRPRPRTDIDLEAGETINLGEFEESAGAHALSISEARLIVERTEQVRKQKNGRKLRETEYVAYHKEVKILQGDALTSWLGICRKCSPTWTPSHDFEH